MGSVTFPPSLQLKSNLSFAESSRYVLLSTNRALEHAVRAGLINSEKSLWTNAGSISAAFSSINQHKNCIASGLSNKEVAWRHLHTVASSSFSSPEEDSSSLPSEELGPKNDLNLPRRRLQVSFTCDACGARSERLINPHAYDHGTVFVQCAGCEVYHQLADNLGLIEEYDFRLEKGTNADGSGLNEMEEAIPYDGD